MSVALAQDRWREQVISQLQAQDQRASEIDMRKAQEHITGELEEDEFEYLDLRLQSGIEYMVFGVCDADCEDLDIEVNSQSGDLLGKDTADDDFPIVRFTPPRTGVYRVKVTMFECSTDPCRYGIAVYQEE